MVMIGRKARKDPSIFTQSLRVLNNEQATALDHKRVISRFKDLYKQQNIQRDSELRDHLKSLNKK